MTTQRNMTESEWFAYLEQGRKDAFAYKIEDTRYDGEIRVSVTTNGRQWFSLNLRPGEWQQVHQALGQYLERGGSGEGGKE